mgnify:CR=1 FL=1
MLAIGGGVRGAYGVKIARVFRHTRAEDVVIEGDFSLAKEWNFKLQA